MAQDIDRSHRTKLVKGCLQSKKLKEMLCKVWLIL